MREQQVPSYLPANPAVRAQHYQLAKVLGWWAKPRAGASLTDLYRELAEQRHSHGARVRWASVTNRLSGHGRIMPCDRASNWSDAARLRGRARPSLVNVITGRANVLLLPAGTVIRQRRCAWPRATNRLQKAFLLQILELAQ